jgi:hypothetical protein
MYLGDFAAGSTVRGLFNTRKADGTPITLAGTPTLGVYKDGGTTETTTGVTLTVDFDSRTGLHLFAIDTSDAFYSTGSDFTVVISAGTVDSISVVGAVAGRFSINNRISTPTLVADAILSRNVSNVETTMPEHCLGTVVLAMLEHSITGNTLTIKRTNGITTHATKTLATDANALPITGVD